MARSPGILKAGQLFDRFRIVKCLGRGGMGEVYLALDKSDNRNVAIKVIKAGMPAFDRMLAWFRREVELYRKITHPNVVNFIASGEVDGIHYVALEQIIGLSLRQWLNRHSRCTLRRAFSWMQDLVFALHAAHQRDVVHRDIKPENIMITRDGRPKLIDFGLARVQGHRCFDEVNDVNLLVARGRPKDGMLSGDSGIVGTLSYMAPEVFAGRVASKCSDIYSLGLVFYEMLTGQILLQGNENIRLIMERQSEADSMTGFLPRPVSPLGEALEGFVLRMLKSSPEERFDSTNAMVDAMKAVSARFPGETGADGGDKGKRLAQQELVDTHYWRAMSLFAERRVAEAVDELLNIVTFASALSRSSAGNICRELDLLFYALRPGEKDSVGTGGSGADTGDPREQGIPAGMPVRLLVRVMRLYSAVGEPWNIRLKMAVLLEKLAVLLPEHEFERTVRDLILHHAGDRSLTRAFIDSMLETNPTVAADVWLKFIRELVLCGRLWEAAEELEACTARVGHTRESRACGEELRVLEGLYEDELNQVEALLDELEREGASERYVTVCLSFLKKYPESTRILRRLALVYGREQRRRKLLSICSRLGVISYWRGREDESLRYFKAVLDIDERDRTAINYVTEILRRRGELEVTGDYRSLCSRIYRRLGNFNLLLRDLERRLTGTGRDEGVYLEMIEAAQSSGHAGEVWRFLFEIGRIRLESGDLDGARLYFDRGLKQAPPEAGAVAALQAVPGIRKVYTLAELGDLGRKRRR